MKTSKSTNNSSEPTRSHAQFFCLDQIHAKFTEMLVYRITIILFVPIIHVFYSCILDMHVYSFLYGGQCPGVMDIIVLL